MEFLGKSDIMTTPMMDDALYGVKYRCQRFCPKCKGSNWYDLTATGHLLCLDCGHQEPVED